MKLLSISDIAKNYCIPRHTVWNWHRRLNNFPKPIQYIGQGRSPLFDQEDVEDYLKKVNN